MMNQLQAMRIFLKVAENGSFGRAAASLDMSNAVVTRYVALLESHLNTRLVNRTTRHVSLTEAGMAYADGCRGIIEQLGAMDSSLTLSTSEPTGTLKLVAAASFSLFRLTPLLQEYRLRHPKVKLSVTLLHRSVNLVEEGFDAGIVVPAQIKGSTLIRRPLFRVCPIAVASPGYIRLHGMPVTPAHLATQTFLAPSAEIHNSDWTFTALDGREETVSLEPAYVVNNAAMLRQAALADMGITILPESHVAADLSRGTLVHVLPDYRIQGADKEVALVYPGRRHVSAKTRSFVEFAVDYFRTGSAPVSSAAFPDI
ncbi:MAG: LysR family transcriptional regulator [Paraburkholderia sp.]|uniref:LysR family transcriptional regulator n=1 Tax=Paraburkholderia sp. TaxID=1926495 RepID=UPI003C44E79D